MAQVTGPYDIEAVRKEWIGKRTPVRAGRYPVEYEPIRRFCHMVEDTNPLFLDPDYAATTQYGSVIAPPVMMSAFSGPGIWPVIEEGIPLIHQVPTLGQRSINLGVETEFLRPVKIGDRLTSYSEIVDIFIKPIQLDPKAVWVVTENRISNQNGELVAVGRNTGLRHRSPEEVAADSDNK